MNLPHHRRYNWRIAFRGWLRPFLLCIIAVLMAVVFYFAEGMVLEMLARKDAEHANLDLKRDVLQLASFGAMTQTDYEEGTIQVKVRMK